MGIKTDTQIRALKPKPDRYGVTIQSPKLTKGSIQVIVNPKGKKSFKTLYRYGGKQKGFSVGTYPNTKLAGAIEKHNEAMEKLDEGIDPKVYYQHKLAELKSKLVMDGLFIKWHKIKQTERNISQSTIDNHKWRWDKYLSPEIGVLHVDTIKRQHIAVALEKIGQSSREEGRKSLSTLNMMFNYAVSSGFITESPSATIKASHLGLNAAKPRERWLNLDEIIALWKYLEKSEIKNSLQTKTAIKLAILTGARRNEIATMEWSEIDQKKEIWTIPSEKAKNRQKHVVYLSSYALSLIEQLKALNNQGKYVFESPIENKDEKLLHLSKDGFSRAVARISKKMKIDDFTFHDLRRSAASNWGEKLRASSDVVELMLNHVPKNKLVATYQRSSRRTEQKEIWLQWGQLIQKKV